MAAKSGGKILFCKKPPVDSADTLRVKNFVKIDLSRSVFQDKHAFAFMQKFKIAAKSGEKKILGKSR